ncbi:MAG: hypothetical protein K1W17_02050 [Oscillospiraceae bacterium]
MKIANSDIRKLMKQQKVPAYAIAAVLGVHENTVFRRLRFELSETDRKKFVQIINDVAEQDKNTSH